MGTVSSSNWSRVAISSCWMVAVGVVEDGVVLEDGADAFVCVMLRMSSTLDMEASEFDSCM